MLKQTFIALLSKYTDDEPLVLDLWNEISRNYSKKNRFYHTLQHLENLLSQLTDIQPQIKDWDTILFTLYYHDLVYDSVKSDNEKQSADLAEKRLKQAKISTEIIEKCKAQIMATKAHLLSSDEDTNYFTDADLSVLGQNWEVYMPYFQNVRKEYSIYPDFLYNPGRKKVLKHFLAMDRIFKTDYFYPNFEQKARENLAKELNILNHN
jgi:predicted metal-dependent HD superfamily phosphohydrolase